MGFASRSLSLMVRSFARRPHPTGFLAPLADAHNVAKSVKSSRYTLQAHLGIAMDHTTLTRIFPTQRQAGRHPDPWHTYNPALR